ncbi:MAG: YaiO family outer membrane beta-barrel protein [Candidatus Binatia bacterium]
MEASLAYAFESLSPRLPDSHTYTVKVRRTFSSGSLALEAIRTRRFSRWDEAVAADGFLDLWRRAYGNLRLQAGIDNEVLPRMESTVEIFQGFGEGWELSGSYRYTHSSEENVDVYGVSLAKYVGDWFLRWRAAFVPKREGLSFSHAFFMRRYFETVDDFAEFGAGAGREVGASSTGLGKEIRRPYLLSFRAQKFFLTWLGVSISANYSNDNLAPRRVVSVGIIMRW